MANVAFGYLLLRKGGSILQTLASVRDLHPEALRLLTLRSERAEQTISDLTRANESLLRSITESRAAADREELYRDRIASLERQVAEAQSAVIGFADARLQATLTRQRGFTPHSDEPEENVPTRWGMASGRASQPGHKITIQTDGPLVGPTQTVPRSNPGSVDVPVS